MTAEQRTGEYGTYSVDEAALSKGGVGSIHRTNNPSLVYKKYLDPRGVPVVEDIRRLVSVGRRVLVQQKLQPGQTPESSVNWPVDLDVDSLGRLVGVVLPLIPPALFNHHGGVNTLDFLIMKRANPPRAVGRVALLLRMAEILAYVDSQQLVHGDINSKNLAWSLDPEPIMYLIDCDGMVAQDPPPRKGVGAAGWIDPRVHDQLAQAHDRYSDHYALALAMYRGLLLTPGNLGKEEGGWKKPTQIPSSLDAGVAELLTRALSAPLDHRARPTPAEWVRALQTAYLPNGTWNQAALKVLPEAGEAPAQAPRFVKIPAIPPPPAPPPPPPIRRPPPPAARRRPRQLVPPQPVPLRQPPPPVPTPQPVQRRPPQPAPMPNFMINGSPVSSGTRSFPTGKVGYRALEGRPMWYVWGLLSSLILPVVPVIYCAVGLFQLRRLDSTVRGGRRARVFLWIFLIIGSAVTARTAAAVGR